MARKFPAQVLPGTVRNSAVHLVTLSSRRKQLSECFSAGTDAKDSMDSLVWALDIFIFLQARTLNHYLSRRFRQIIVAEYHQPHRIRQVMKCLFNLKQKFVQVLKTKRIGKPVLQAMLLGGVCSQPRWLGISFWSCWIRYILQLKVLGQQCSYVEKNKTKLQALLAKPVYLEE